MDLVLNWLWQGALVAAAAGTALIAMRRARAASRYAFCCGAIAAILALPVLAGFWPPIGPRSGGLAAATPPAVELPAAWWSSVVPVLGAWGGWILVGLARAVAALTAVRAARAQARPFPPAIEARLGSWNRVRLRGRRARLALSDSAGAAAVLAVGPALIVVSPHLVARLSDEELDRVVVHEWAHVQRRDDVAGLVHLVIQILAGWHPAIWWLQRQMVIEREAACDEIAVAETGSARRYAACLARTAGAMLAARAPLAAVGALSSPSLVPRVARILAADRLASRVRSRHAASAAALVVSALSVTLARAPLVGMAAGLEGVMERVAPGSGRTAIHLPPRARAASQVPDSPTDALRRRPASGSDRRRSPELPDREDSGPRPVLADADRPGAAAGPAAILLDASLLTHEGAPRLPAPVAVDGNTTASPPPDAGPPPPTDDGAPSPWSAAADAGVAVGRASQKAAVRTSGFFSRLGRRIASSFEP